MSKRRSMIPRSTLIVASYTLLGAAEDMILQAVPILRAKAPEKPLHDWLSDTLADSAYGVAISHQIADQLSEVRAWEETRQLGNTLSPAQKKQRQHALILRVAGYLQELQELERKVVPLKKAAQESEALQ